MNKKNELPGMWANIKKTTTKKYTDEIYAIKIQ